MLSGDGRNILEKEIRSRMKTVFGKGPENIEISFLEKTIVVVIKGFLTKVEKPRMKERGGKEGIRDFRYAEMKNEMAEILKNEAFCGIEFKDSYMDVHASEDSACFVIFTTKE